MPLATKILQVQDVFVEKYQSREGSKKFSKALDVPHTVTKFSQILVDTGGETKEKNKK